MQAFRYIKCADTVRYPCYECPPGKVFGGGRLEFACCAGSGLCLRSMTREVCVFWTCFYKAPEGLPLKA